MTEEAEQPRKVSSPDVKPGPAPDPPALPASVEQSKAKTLVEVRVALITALAVLIGALAGAMATGYYTSIAVERQIAAQAEQGLREQRQGIYTQLIQKRTGCISGRAQLLEPFPEQRHPVVPAPRSNSGKEGCPRIGAS